MPIYPKTQGLHHIALRSTDFKATKKFYHEILGCPVALDSEEILGFMAGNIFIGFKKAMPTHENGGVFTPFNVGLDHIALACETEEELQRVTKELTESGIENTGIKTDPVSQKSYVAFKDPGRISWEFYMV